MCRLEIEKQLGLVQQWISLSSFKVFYLPFPKQYLIVKTSNTLQIKPIQPKESIVEEEVLSSHFWKLKTLRSQASTSKCRGLVISGSSMHFIQMTSCIFQRLNGFASNIVVGLVVAEEGVQRNQLHNSYSSKCSLQLKNIALHSCTRVILVRQES